MVDAGSDRHVGGRGRRHARRAAAVLRGCHRNRADAPADLSPAPSSDGGLSEVDLRDAVPRPVRARSHDSLTAWSAPRPCTSPPPRGTRPSPGGWSPGGWSRWGMVSVGDGPKARDYRKLHLAVDEQTSDVVACELTSKRARDASRVASLVGQIERPIASAKADAAYDTGDVYKTLENHRAHRSPKVLIPPRKGAQLALDSAGTRQRNRNIRARSRVGKRKWYVASGYSRRSKVETTFHRYKAILGSAMRARGLASQRVEVRLGCKILNTMTALGIPDGEIIG